MSITNNKNILLSEIKCREKGFLGPAT